MNLYENILRINDLIKETSINEKFIKIGDVSVLPGINIKLLKDENEEIGETNLIDMKSALENDFFLKSFLIMSDHNMNIISDDIIINNDNSLFVHDVRVDEKFRGNGYGKKIMNKCHEIAKKMNYGQTCLLVQKNNDIANALYTKLGYFKLDDDNERNFLIKKL